MDAIIYPQIGLFGQDDQRQILNLKEIAVQNGWIV